MRMFSISGCVHLLIQQRGICQLCGYGKVNITLEKHSYPGTAEYEQGIVQKVSIPAKYFGVDLTLVGVRGISARTRLAPA